MIVYLHRDTLLSHFQERPLAPSVVRFIHTLFVIYSLLEFHTPAHTSSFSPAGELRFQTPNLHLIRIPSISVFEQLWSTLTFPMTPRCSSIINLICLYQRYHQPFILCILLPFAPYLFILQDLLFTAAGIIVIFKKSDHDAQPCLTMNIIKKF